MPRLFPAAVLALFAGPLPAADVPFRVQQFAADLSIGYAVTVVDVNGDAKPDIVVVDKHRVVWYENPTWKPRMMLQGGTKPDNVCIAAADLTGDGLPEFVIGAAWKPGDTTNPGTLQWIERGKSLDEPWAMHPIPCDEPMVHRVKIGEINGKPHLLSVPLMGRGATAKGNWTDGKPVRITAYPLPADPRDPAAWKPVVLNEELHVCHNFVVRNGVLAVANYGGLHAVGLGTPAERMGAGNQANPQGSRGSSEVAGRDALYATVEPWHGHEIVAYHFAAPGKLLRREVIDDRLRWGHAVAFADLDGDGTDELIAGVRDDPNPRLGDTFAERRGVRVYRREGEKWMRQLVDPGGVAVEDLVVADLNGDGKPDIVAVGRATGNGRIYWNESGK